VIGDPAPMIELLGLLLATLASVLRSRKRLLLENLLLRQQLQVPSAPSAVPASAPGTSSCGCSSTCPVSPACVISSGPQVFVELDRPATEQGLAAGHQRTDAGVVNGTGDTWWSRLPRRSRRRGLLSSRSRWHVDRAAAVSATRSLPTSQRILSLPRPRRGSQVPALVGYSAVHIRHLADMFLLSGSATANWRGVV
jgi:hypothetical protein